MRYIERRGFYSRGVHGGNPAIVRIIGYSDFLPQIVDRIKFKLTAIMIHHDMNLALEYANRVAVIKDGDKVLEIGVDGEQIIDFQTGDLTQEEIMEMYNEPQK